jgi:ribosomal protein S18 acetylase RimI-like enzyme
MALQQAYQQVYPKTVIIPGESYLSPAFASGENIFCAFDAADTLQGYAALVPNFAVAKGVPHTVWTGIKVYPSLASPRPLQNALFQKVVHRAGEITRPLPGHETRLTFQHHASESAVIEYVKSQGCAYRESIFHMGCDLYPELQVFPIPAGINLHYSAMDDIVEQEAYVAARNEAFPASATTLEGWQYFFQAFIREKGKVIVADDGRQLAGSILVYWDEVLNRRLGIILGTIGYVFVREGWRKHGLAAGMLGFGLKYLKEQGFKSADLEVYASNRRALGLYERMGFKVIDETQLFVLKL